jgi:hypothetical protein
MLKIKDNVDLKELEKFGFEYKEWYCDYKKFWIKHYRFQYISVKLETKEITLLNKEIWQKNYDESLEKIYDLIQAGLVEKVE